MADVAGLALSVAGAGAKLSLVLFDVVNAFKTCRKEISDIAQELSTLSAVLELLSQVITDYGEMCKPELFGITKATLNRFDEVSEELTAITGTKKKLRRLRWFFDGPKAKALLQKVEGIKSSLTLVLSIIKIAVEQANSSHLGTISQPPSQSRSREIAESVVQTNRLIIEDAKRPHFHGAIQLWSKDSSDTATWLYHLVFGTGDSDESIIPANTNELDLATGAVVVGENAGRDASDTALQDGSKEGVASVHFDNGTKSSSRGQPPCMEVIKWNSKTEPSSVVNRLLQAWTYFQPSPVRASIMDHEPTEDHSGSAELLSKIREYLRQKDNRRENRDCTAPFEPLRDEESIIASDSDACYDHLKQKPEAPDPPSSLDPDPVKEGDPETNITMTDMTQGNRSVTAETTKNDLSWVDKTVEADSNEDWSVFITFKKKSGKKGKNGDTVPLAGPAHGTALTTYNSIDFKDGSEPPELHLDFGNKTADARKLSASQSATEPPKEEQSADNDWGSSFGGKNKDNKKEKGAAAIVMKDSFPPPSPEPKPQHVPVLISRKKEGEGGWNNWVATTTRKGRKGVTGHVPSSPRREPVVIEDNDSIIANDSATTSDYESVSPSDSTESYYAPRPSRRRTEKPPNRSYPTSAQHSAPAYTSKLTAPNSIMRENPFLETSPYNPETFGPSAHPGYGQNPGYPSPFPAHENYQPGHRGALPPFSMPPLPGTNPFFQSKPPMAPYARYEAAVPPSQSSKTNPPLPSEAPPPPSLPPPPLLVPTPAPPPDESRHSRILELIAKQEANRQEDLLAIENQFARILESISIRETQDQEHRAPVSSDVNDELGSRLDALHGSFTQYKGERDLRDAVARTEAEAEKQNEQRKREDWLREQARLTRELAEREAAVRKARQDVEEGAARKSQEAKDLVEKQLASILAEVKATNEAQKKAMEEAAKRAKEEAETRAAKEKKQADDNYRRLIDMYEEQLTSYRKREEEQQSNMQPAPLPLRTTFVADGERHAEVHEYTNERMEPLITTQLDPSRRGAGSDFAFDFLRPSKIDHRPSLNRYSTNSFRGSTASVVTQRSDERQSCQQKTIMLPSKPARNSSRTTQMQSCLEQCGVVAQFESPDDQKHMLAQPSLGTNNLMCGTLFWEPATTSLNSELLRNLHVQGWKPLYLRISEFGQTYFLGNRPIHVNFFKPQYRPQLEPPYRACPSEYVVLGKDLVHEHALEELGFQFRLTDTGAYALDSRLTSDDIDVLIERSFMIRETSFRRQFRQLAWEDDTQTLDEGYVASSLSDNCSVTDRSADDTDCYADESNCALDVDTEIPQQGFQMAKNPQAKRNYAPVTSDFLSPPTTPKVQQPFLGTRKNAPASPGLRSRNPFR